MVTFRNGFPYCVVLYPYRKDDVKEADAGKDAAVEAELKAARDRALVPLEARMNQFRDMLLERGVKHLNPTQFSNQLCNVRHINLNGSPPRYNLKFILVALIQYYYYNDLNSSVICRFHTTFLHVFSELL